MLYSNMGKSKKTKSIMKQVFVGGNILLLTGLVLYAYIYFVNMKEGELKEGVRNMNCCGGIEAGVHYKETDTKPPPYVQRCFQSGGGVENEGTIYKWDGFPCTSKGSSDCCKQKDGGNGTCIATSKGGYCRSSSGGSNFIFNRRDSKPSIYLKHSNDRVIDINDINDMKDYYYERSEKDTSSGLSREMREFNRKREQNEAYMERQLLNKKIQSNAVNKDKQNKLDEQQKSIQITTTLTIIHLLFIVTFAIVIRELIIEKIEGFYDFLGTQYATFQGKTVG